jgi:methionyl-tRNA formyltransferase
MVPRDLRIVFMGTPGFAVPGLQYLREAGYPVVAVVTAPDKPGGRGLRQWISSPVKQYALQHEIPVLQPDKLRSKTFLSELKELNPDLFVVVAFRMLPESVWSLPPLGTINLHGSLLPAYRGAAPIQWAIIRGEKITGVTTFFLQHEIDTGEILLQRKIPILPEDDAGNLHDRMMIVGAGLVTASADLIQKGNYTTQKQDSSNISHAPKINHQNSHISWDAAADQIRNLIRGMAPFPGAWTILDGMECKIYKASVHHTDETISEAGKLHWQDKKLLVQTGRGILEILEVQLAGKKRMAVKDFLNGYRIKDWSVT